MNITYLAKALSLGAVLRDGEPVLRVEEGGGRVRVYTSKGEYQCEHLVLSAGVIGTPTLLLRSGIDAGRGLQFHLQTVAWGDFAERVDMQNGIPMSYGVTEFADIYGQRGPGFVMEGVGVQPMAFAVQTAAEGELQAQILKRYRHLSGVLSLVRSSSRGQLKLDKKGEPAFAYNLNRHDCQRLGLFFEKASELFLAAGANRVLLAHRTTRWVNAPPKNLEIGPNRQYLYTAHPFGGACRGDVLNGHGLVRGKKKIWVSDASAFPEALGVNPQVTIAALALELGNRILEMAA